MFIEALKKSLSYVLDQKILLLELPIWISILIAGIMVGSYFSEWIYTQRPMFLIVYVVLLAAQTQLVTE